MCPQEMLSEKLKQPLIRKTCAGGYSVTEKESKCAKIFTTVSLQGGYSFILFLQFFFFFKKILFIYF